MDNIARYLKIMDWAQRRYVVKGYLIRSIGGIPSRYSIIERLAAEKLLGCSIHPTN